MLRKLSAILRYIIYDCHQSFVPLEKELKMLQDYVSLEQVRYGSRLKITFSTSGDCNNKRISPLLLIPLVENSFKHGVSKMLDEPWINLDITVEGLSLLFFLANGRPEVKATKQHNGQIGLKNVKRRLQLIFPESHEIIIEEGTKSFQVLMKISLQDMKSLEQDYKNEKEYGVA